MIRIDGRDDRQIWVETVKAEVEFIGFEDNDFLGFTISAGLVILGVTLFVVCAGLIIYPVGFTQVIGIVIGANSSEECSKIDVAFMQ